jgi:VWFA-related protein
VSRRFRPASVAQGFSPACDARARTRLQSAPIGCTKEDVHPWRVVPALLVTAVVGAQPPQPPRPTFRGGTNLVRVDAAVTDDRGQPVLDLTQKEFELIEDGQPQTIESFKLVQLNGEQDPGDEESLPIRSDEHGRAEAARDDVRVFAIFLDDYHVARQAETIRAQNALTDFVKTMLGPRDLVAVMDPLTPLDALRFTRDRDALAMRIRAFDGRRGVYLPPRSAAEEEQLARAQNIERVRTEVTLSALKALVTHLGSIRESRKAVIFLSGGFGLGRDMWNDLAEVYTAANQANTAIYPLDPGWLGSRNSMGLDVLRTLADNSGGRAIVNQNRFDRALEQIVRDASAYYLLGYTSTHAANDGKFREIKVRVTRRGLDVRARKGYWALTAEEARRSEIVTPPPPTDIAQAFAALAVSRSGRPIDSRFEVTRGGTGLMRLGFVWEIRAQRDAAAASRAATVHVTAYDADGHERFQGDAPAAGADVAPLAFELPPGPAKVKIDALNQDGESIDVEMRDIAVPDLWTPAASLSSPRVVRARDGRQFQILAADADAPGSAGREFRRTDRLLVRFSAYAGARDEVKVTARLVTKTGATLVPLPVAPFTPGGVTHQIDLPLANLAPGDFVLRIEATAGGATAVELVPLRVQ